jgi:hypothetical protein
MDINGGGSVPKSSYDTLPRFQKRRGRREIFMTFVYCITQRGVFEILQKRFDFLPRMVLGIFWSLEDVAYAYKHYTGDALLGLHKMGIGHRIPKRVLLC